MNRPYIEIYMENRDVYGVPLQFVAEHRAKYYAEKDPVTTFEREVQYAMENKYEAIDWLRNNMNWSDFSSVVEKIRSAPVIPPYDAWHDAECTIIR